jgi:alginate lyase/concanavalin A-like lectin/glucanase superfamily protein
VAVRFDAAGDRLYLAATLPTPSSTGLTVLGWWRLRVDRNDFSTYYRTENSGGSTIHTCASFSSGQDVNVFTTSGELDSGYTNAVDEWVAVAVVDTGSGVTLYVRPDGGTTDVTAGSVGSGTPAQLTIGGRADDDASEWLNGNAGYVRVFADALTQAEVEAEWDSTTPVLTAWADWPLVDDVQDASGNGRHLTQVSGSPAFDTDPPVAVVYDRAGGAAGAAAGTGAVSTINVPPDLLPSDVLDLSYWHLTTPEDDGDGTAEQIDQPELDSYETSNFFADTVDGRPCVVFRADVDGFSTSEASGATRMELRQHDKSDYDNTAVNPTTAGRYQLTITTYADPTDITGDSTARQELIICQIHGAGDSPIPLILSAEWESGGNPVTPRVRIFKNGSGVGNLIAPSGGITPDTPLSIRIRFEDDRLKLWGVAGQKEDLPSIETSTTWDWPIDSSNFTDRSGWYFKSGAYNKTPITANASGVAVAKVVYLNVLEPGDDEEVFSTTYERTGGSGAKSAGSAAVEVVSAQVFTRTGAAGAAAAGSAAAQVVPAAEHERTGAGATAAAATGTRALAPATTYDRSGGSGASGASTAAVEVELHAEHDVLGGAAAGAAGSGSVELVAPARVAVAGAAAVAVTGSGAQVIVSAVTYELSGAAGVAGGAHGSRQIGGGTEYSRDGAAGVAPASAGAVDVASPDTYERLGGAAPALASAGAAEVQSAETHVRTGGAASSPAAAGERELVRPAVHTRAGSAGAVPAGSGAANVESSGTSHARTGAGAAAAGASGAAEVAPATRHDRSGGSAGTAAGVCLLEVIESPIHVREGGAAAALVGAGRVRRGGRLRAAVPVALGQFRAGTPVRR